MVNIGPPDISNTNNDYIKLKHLGQRVNYLQYKTNTNTHPFQHTLQHLYIRKAITVLDIRFTQFLQKFDNTVKMLPVKFINLINYVLRKNFKKATHNCCFVQQRYEHITYNHDRKTFCVFQSSHN